MGRNNHGTKVRVSGAFLFLKRWGSLFVFGLILFVTTVSAIAQVDDLLTISKESTITTSSKSPFEVAREIQSSILSETARAQAIEIMGEKRYAKNKTLVESKIIRQSAKFIPFVNPGQPTQQPDGTWKMTVELKLSRASLRKMIFDAGFMSDADGPAAILPMVSFSDRKSGVSSKWWKGEPKDEAHKFLGQVSEVFHEQMQKEFVKQGFHAVKPLVFVESVMPEAYRVDHPSHSDLSFISEFFGTPMIMRGDLRIRESRDMGGLPGAQIGVKLEVVQSVSGRLIAELSRQIEVDGISSYEAAVVQKLKIEMPDLAKDLASQVLEAWQRGALSSNVMRLQVRGNLNPKQLNDLKSSLLQSVREIKGLKERSFEGGVTVFEMDYSGEATGVIERLKGLHLAGFETRVVDATDKQVGIDAKIR